MTKKRNDEHYLVQSGIVNSPGIRRYDEYLFAIPNGGLRDKITAAKLKREGVQAGVWDLFLMSIVMQPHGVRHGLWIEVKVGRDRLSPEQRAFGRYAYSVHQDALAIVTTVQQGVDTILAYRRGDHYMDDYTRVQVFGKE